MSLTYSINTKRELLIVNNSFISNKKTAEDKSSAVSIYMLFDNYYLSIPINSPSLLKTSSKLG